MKVKKKEMTERQGTEKLLQDQINLINQALPLALSVDLALRAIVCAPLCTDIKQMRFLIDLLARILSRTEDGYLALRQAAEKSGVAWPTGSMPQDSAQLALLREGIFGCIREIANVEKEIAVEKKN